MALEQWQYGDPEKVLIRKQEQQARAKAACGACIHQSGIVFKNEVVHVCKFKKHIYGKRCELYEPTLPGFPADKKRAL